MSFVHLFLYRRIREKLKKKRREEEEKMKLQQSRPWGTAWINENRFTTALLIVCFVQGATPDREATSSFSLLISLIIIIN